MASIRDEGATLVTYDKKGTVLQRVPLGSGGSEIKLEMDHYFSLSFNPATKKPTLTFTCEGVEQTFTPGASRRQNVSSGLGNDLACKQFRRSLLAPCLTCSCPCCGPCRRPAASATLQ